MKKILISAIEVSADMHAANLVNAIKRIDPTINFLGFGSELLSEQGVKIYQDLTQKSTVGLIEPIKHLVSYLKSLGNLKKLLKKENPDAFFCIDGQGFHLPAATIAKKLKIPVIYYITPQEWLWGTKKGGRKAAALCDLMIAIFPEEAAFYNKLKPGCAIYNGHPLVDIVKPTISREDFFKKHNLDQQKKLLVIFPGSRRQELEKILPILYKTAKLYQKENIQVLIVAANKICWQKISEEAPETKVILKENYNAINAADLVISSTGTITLEAALLLKPLVSIYKLGTISYLLAKLFFGRRIPKYMALPNMITGREITPEIIQYGVTPHNIKKRADELLKNPEPVLNELIKLKEQLAKKDILKNNAEQFINFLKERQS